MANNSKLKRHWETKLKGAEKKSKMKLNKIAISLKRD